MNYVLKWHCLFYSRSDPLDAPFCEVIQLSLVNISLIVLTFKQLLTIAPPTPLQRQSPGCDWQTPSNTPSWEMMLQLLSLHDKNVHPAAQTNGPSTIKLERLPRPVFSLNMTEATWQFKVIEWQSYIGQAPTTSENKLLQLRAACDDELRQRIYDSGDYMGLNTESKFLERMKNLALI